MQFFEIDNRKVTMALNAMRWQLDHQPLPVAVRLGLGLISLMSNAAMAPSKLQLAIAIMIATIATDINFNLIYVVRQCKQ